MIAVKQVAKIRNGTLLGCLRRKCGADGEVRGKEECGWDKKITPLW
jgi:hypothetical protein